MDETNITRYIDTCPVNDIIKYSSRSDLAKDHVSFTGAPRKHPYDPKKILLISDPFSSNTIVFEFTIEDIVHIEEISHIVSEAGEGLHLVRIWVKKGSIGIKYEPFVVADTLNFLSDTETLLQHE
jgi:hypothetical protein